MKNKTKKQLEIELQEFKNDADNWNRFLLDLDKFLPHYEAKLSYRVSGSPIDRIHNVLRQFETTASTSIFKAKDFIDDAKTQFKALELVVEGISYDGYNHTQKRVIANHVVNLLRNMVQRINQIDFEYSSGMYERYDFFRSQSPEKELYRKYNELKQELEQYKGMDGARKIKSDEKDPLPF